ncbi:iron-hydroxamate ABC transporter substrate-binding protein [Barrientosiimonas marina]
MIKKIFPFLLLLVLVLSACGSGDSSDEASDQAKEQGNENQDEQATRTYESQNGPVEVPKHPERVVVLSTYAGDLASLGVNVVGVDKWTKQSSVLKDELGDAEVVSSDNLEGIIDLNPDLIVGREGANTKNLDKLKEIAPTVTYEYGKLDYLEQHIAIGKLVNKEDKAKEWVEDFKQRAEKIGNKIKDKIGKDATVSVMENFNKQFYIAGQNWGRGSEIVYHAMDLTMPDKVKKATEENGYQEISTEAVPEYAGDYIVLSRAPGTDSAFQNTET